MEPFTGEIATFPYTYAPYNWADCNGQAVSIQQYTALYAIIGQKFSNQTPPSQTSFPLPNLMGRIPIGQGQGPGLTNRSWGQTGGQETVTLTSNQMPLHNHTLSFEQETTEMAAPMGNYPGVYRQNNKGVFLYDTNGVTNTTSLSPQAIGASGGSQPHINMQPYMVLRFCIALAGNFPTRN